MERTWTPERVGCWYMVGGGWEGGGGRGNGRITEQLFLSEFRVFHKIGARCVLMKRKRKRVKVGAIRKWK